MTKNKITSVVMSLLKPGLDNIKAQYHYYKDNAGLSREKKIMNRAIKEAVTRSEATRKTYYVLKDWNGVPYAASRRELLVMQRSGMFKHEMSVYDLMKEALFIARGLNGVEKKAEKKK